MIMTEYTPKSNSDMLWEDFGSNLKSIASSVADLLNAPGKTYMSMADQKALGESIPQEQQARSIVDLLGVAFPGMLGAERDALGMFGGKASAIRSGNKELLDRYAKAEELLSQGAHPVDIFRQTKLHVGEDGLLRHEYSDDAMTFNIDKQLANLARAQGKDINSVRQSFENNEQSIPGLVKDFIQHPEMSRLNPEQLSDFMRVVPDKELKSQFSDIPARGAYDYPKYNERRIQEAQGKSPRGIVSLNKDAPVPEQTIAHELQHGIQDKDDLHPTTRYVVPKNLKEYRAHTAEREAKDTAIRQKLTDEERELYFPEALVQRLRNMGYNHMQILDMMNKANPIVEPR